jgi:hypothetical protein
LLGWRLEREELPGDAAFRKRLTAAARATLGANLERRKWFEDLRDVLAGEGITALPIKGVDVAFVLYPSPACRPFTDVDLLVSPDNYAAAGDVLTREGFAPLKREPRWWPGRTWRRGGVLVDLHWSPAAALPPRRGMAELVYHIGGEDDIKNEFRLLVAVCHAQNHFFSLPLIYFWEGARLAAGVDPETYARMARLWSAVRATRLVLEWAGSFFGVPSPAPAAGWLARVAAPAAAGAEMGRGARAALTYALSLDNPWAAFAWGFKRPAWAREILTRGD